MIKINIPNNNISERKYIVDIIFYEFLELDYKIVINDTNNWEIVLENDSKIIIEDHFFNKYPKDLEYLKLENIPSNIESVKNEFIVEKDMAIIYGNSKINIENSKSIITSIDIFASSFFMLTRWEEYVNTKRDKHNRFPPQESLAFQYNFLSRPIVNEYIEMLKNMLLKSDKNIKFKKWEYKTVVTHDVDHIYMWDTQKKFLLHLARDLIKKKSLKEFSNSIIYYIQVKFGKKNDPYDTFDYLMNLSERNGLISHFFFMAKGLSKNYDNQYSTNSVALLNIINKIKTRGHAIGIHPTYHAYNNITQFKQEKYELEKNLDTNINFGREHFLRFEIPLTWEIWNKNKMSWDSSMNYSGEDGFRCGICYPFSTFNFITRKKLSLKERPLIVMEANSITKKDMTPKKMKQDIENLNNIVKKYNGEFVFLWHNSSFNTNKWKIYQYVYESILNSSNKAKI